MPSSRRYIEAVTEASGEEAEVQPPTPLNPLARKPLAPNPSRRLPRVLSLHRQWNLLRGCYSAAVVSASGTRAAYTEAIVHHHKTAGGLLTLRESIQR